MDFQQIYLKLLILLGLVTAALCFSGRYCRHKALRFLQSAAVFAAVQGLLCLAFLGCYVLYVKNGFSVSPSRLGVVFFPVSVLVFFLFWRFGGMTRHPLSLVAPALYCGFLLLNCKSLVKTLIFNPIYGFIAAETPFPLCAVAAVLPFLAAAVGRVLAAIDKKL